MNQQPNLNEPQENLGSNHNQDASVQPQQLPIILPQQPTPNSVSGITQEGLQVNPPSNLNLLQEGSNHGFDHQGLFEQLATQTLSENFGALMEKPSLTGKEIIAKETLLEIQALQTTQVGVSYVDKGTEEGAGAARDVADLMGETHHMSDNDVAMDDNDVAMDDNDVTMGDNDVAMDDNDDAFDNNDENFENNEAIDDNDGMEDDEVMEDNEQAPEVHGEVLVNNLEVEGNFESADGALEDKTASTSKKTRTKRVYPVTIKPARKAFSDYTTAQQRRLVKQVIDAIDLIANDEVEAFMDVLRKKTEFGSLHFPGKDTDEKLKTIVRRIGALYSNCPSEHKPDVLSLVARDFSNAQLVNLGFKDLSRAKYNYSVYNKNPRNASLNKYKRFVPASRAKLSDQTQANIVKSLMKFSKLTTQPCVKPVSLPQEVPEYQSDKLYHLTSVIRVIHEDHKNVYGDSMSLTTFSHYVPKNFVKLNKGKNTKPNSKKAAAAALSEKIME